MQEIDGSSKPPQISEMFQKFAIAFKAKTFEFFAEEDDPSSGDGDGFTLLDSAEGFISDQKVVVIKPDATHNNSNPFLAKSNPPLETLNPQLAETLVSSLFATVSSFEASYLQLQTAHVPFDEDAINAADRTLVSHLQRLSDVRRFYRDSRRNPNFNSDFPIGSCLEAQVEENQSKLRTLGTMVNRLQSEIDVKDDQVLVLRRKLNDTEKSNSRLSKRLLMSSNSNPNSGAEVLLTIRVFDSILRETRRSLHHFTKLLIDLMKKAGWDLDLAANSVHPDVKYAKSGHNGYAFLSYISLGMFRNFDLESFDLGENRILCNGDDSNSHKNSFLTQLIEHISSIPMEVLSKSPSCEFSRFYEKKYQELIHPTMKSSIFREFDGNEVVLSSWKSLSVFYESFVKMASSVWLLHKLAHSFNPAVEIFQVERGNDFSMVYMEDITKKYVLNGKSRPKVGFTVVPGFRVGKTVIQSQVYLNGLKCAE